MAGRDRAVPERLPYRRWQVQQPQRVAHVAARLADRLADGLLGQAELVDQPLIAFGLVD